MTRIAYLGPRGSFCEASLQTLDLAAGAELIPAAGVYRAIDMVRDGESDFAMVPIENSVEGAVNLTLDELTNGRPLVIVHEVEIPVQFSLLAPDGVALSDIRRVSTHPHAHAQVAGWLRTHLPDAVFVPATSTAAAAAGLQDEARAYEGAVAQRNCADIYGLNVIADAIADNDGAMTRFVLLSRPGIETRPTGADKTTLSLFIHQDQPGALLAILNEFAVRGVNMTRIESRPTRKHLGDYYFSVDVEGHVDDARVAEALMGLHRICLDVRFLGSYPRFDGRSPNLRAGVRNEDYVEAAQWLLRLKGEG